MKTLFNGIFQGKTVFLTGHTGFKGSWLALWLQELGANVVGYSLPAPTQPSNFICSNVEQGMTHITGDVRNFDLLREHLQKHQPEIVFHLAAQPLVLYSFESPKETFDVNAGGTVNILEAARFCPSIKAMVMITSDKCYENQEWIWGYRETDRLGGHDPYSASKCLAEHIISSYRQSFFKNSGTAVASVRAGNVIGGGDFSDNRIVPDSMKALMKREPVKIRNPQSVRPWLNVLDPLSGYLWLAAKLLEEGSGFAEAWNFGPLEQEAVTVQALVEKAAALWGDGDWVDVSTSGAKPEMNMLRLSWEKAANILKWHPTYDWIAALEQTVAWFKSFEMSCKRPNCIDMRDVCLSHIHEYAECARKQSLAWANENAVAK